MFKLAVSSPFKKRFKKLSKDVQKDCLKDIRHLEKDPFNIRKEANIKKLSGQLKGSYRLRSGDYRIVYEIDRKAKTVVLQTIKHRSNIY